MRTIADLSVPQLLFINSYVEHRDTARAVVDSGAVDHISDCNVLKIGKEWLEMETVQTEISRRLTAQAMASAVTAAEIIDELRKVAFFDPRHLFNADGSIKNIYEMSNEESAALSHLEMISVAEGGTITKIVPSSKLKALELLGKHRRMFIDQVEHSGKGKGVFSMSWEDASKSNDDEKTEEDA